MPTRSCPCATRCCSPAGSRTRWSSSIPAAMSFRPTTRWPRRSPASWPDSPPREAPRQRPASPGAPADNSRRQHRRGEPGGRVSEVSEQFVATPAGTARITWYPAGGRQRALAVLGHGSATGIESADLQALAEALPGQGITVGLVTQPYRLEGNPAADEASADLAWTAAWTAATTAVR